MKSVKKIRIATPAAILAALLVASATTTTWAQSETEPGNEGPRKGQRGGPGRGGNPAERLTEQLGLDEEQSAQVAAIFEDAHEQRMAIKQAEHEEHCALQDSVEEQLMDVLTPDQYSELEALKAEREARQAERELRGRSRGAERQLSCDE